MHDTAPLGAVTKSDVNVNGSAGDVDQDGEIVDELKRRLRETINPAAGLDTDEIASGICRMIEVGHALDEAAL
jgi:hypothetical protein